jgi:hypothetical protein
MEVAETPESRDNDNQSSERRSLSPRTTSPISTPSARDSPQDSPSNDVTLRPKIPDEKSPEPSQTSVAISISDSDDQQAHSTLKPTAGLESPRPSPSPIKEATQCSDVLLISDDDTSKNSDDLHVSDDEVNYSACAHAATPKRNPKRPSFPSLSPSPNTETPKESLDETVVYFNPDWKDQSADDDVLVISDDEEVAPESNERRFSLDQSIANIIDNAAKLLNFTENRSPSPAPMQTSLRKSLAFRKFRSESFLTPEPDRSVHEPTQADVEELSETSDSEPAIAYKSYDEFDELVLGKRVEPEKAELSFIDYCNDDVEFDNSLVQPAAKSPNSTLPETAVVAKPKPKTFAERFEHLNVNVPGQNSVFSISLDNVPLKPDYESMELPQLAQELRNMGLKALQRGKSIQILNHIYYQTHPLMGVSKNGTVTLDTTVPAGCNLMSKYGFAADTKKTKDSKKTKKTKPPPPPVEPASVPEDDLDTLEMEFEASGFETEMDGEEYLLPAKPRKKV